MDARAQEVTFDLACEGLRRAMATACASVDDRYIGYYGTPSRIAVWWTYHVVREARRLGLYPSTAQIEAEIAALKAKRQRSAA